MAVGPVAGIKKPMRPIQRGKGPPPPPAPTPARKVLVSKRLWKLDQFGQSSRFDLRKHNIYELGVQQRDMRILDPNFSNSYPAAILGRENALVLNIEEYKVIVTTTYLLVHEHLVKEHPGRQMSILGELATKLFNTGE